MKKWLSVLLAVVLVMSMLVGCATTPAEIPTEANEDSEPYRIAYIARAQADSFAAWLANEIGRASCRERV